jgi:hypothetical protein
LISKELAILEINVNGAIEVAKLPSFIEEVSLRLSMLGQCGCNCLLGSQDYVVGCLGQLFDEVCRATVVISEN